MKLNFLETLLKWPKNFITGTDLKFILNSSVDDTATLEHPQAYYGKLPIEVCLTSTSNSS